MMRLVSPAGMPGPVVPLAELAAPDARAGLLLATWFSPAFPVGAFSYSHGVETAILGNVIRDAATAEAWIRSVVFDGSGWSDALVLCEAWRAVDADDPARLSAIAELAGAMSPSAERHHETMALGAAFLLAVASGWPSGRLSALTSAAYPVAAGAATAAHGVGLSATLGHFLNAFASSLVSVAVRLVPLGQNAGLRIVAGLQPDIVTMTARALATTLDDLGSATIRSDIASMRHETLYSRIFRS